MNNRIIKILCTYAIMLGMVPAVALAGSKDVVVTKDSSIVMSTFGDCVRTKWNSDTEKCKVDYKKSHIAHEIMAMDERIIYFDFDKSTLKSEEKAKLDVLADVLKEHNVKAVKIVGYTDKIGTVGYNKTLSKERAVTVKHYLDNKVKLNSSVVDMRALGESNQVKSCEGVKGHDKLISCLAPNRRVEVEVDYTKTMK